jgi:hypothetical protein
MKSPAWTGIWVGKVLRRLAAAMVFSSLPFAITVH